MPRIETGSGGAGTGFPLIYKVIAGVALISCAGWYGVYQYGQSRKPRIDTLALAAQAKISKEKRALEEFDNLNLTPDQKVQLAALEDQATSTKELKRQARRLLTPEQKELAKKLSADEKAERDLKQRERQEKLAKKDPSGQLAAERERRKAEKDKPAP